MARTYEVYLRVKEKINFICSSQRVIFFLLHRYECFKNKKTRRKTKDKQRNDVSDIFTSKVWKICHSYPGCSFIWNLWVAYFTVKHSYLCNKPGYDIYERGLPRRVLMSLCRSFSDLPVAYLASDKCRCRFFARMQMFAKWLILLIVKSKRP